MTTVLQRSTEPIKMRNYGRIIQNMVTYACTLPNNGKRRALVIYIAQCMRQKNVAWNKDQESGLQRVKADIVKLSDGRLNCDFEGFDEQVQSIKVEAKQPQQQGNKKKKK
ncbi:MAG: DUF4290 domain-containing protein [Paludibacteraceae bacterium]|nr:DUF4290 domain-containing protein [Paludibacteraceae bacterium]MBP5642409.1 DUF4290 domain-containing protein [Paludibacteraceae bacterium]